VVTPAIICHLSLPLDLNKCQSCSDGHSGHGKAAALTRFSKQELPRRKEYTSFEHIGQYANGGGNRDANDYGNGRDALSGMEAGSQSARRRTFE
jgi:hypothetical protein